MTNVLAIVPARGGSKGIPGKNLAMCAGKPLIKWTLEAALDSVADEVVVTSDDEAILQCANRPVGLTDWAAIISDDAQIEDRLDEIIQTGTQASDIIVLLQPTSPVRTGKQIDEAIEQLQREGADSLVSVVEGHSFLWQQTIADGFSPMVISLSYQPQLGERPRRQDMEQYEENGSIYVFTREHWERTHNRLGGKISLYVMPEECRIQVDTPFDLWMAEQILVRQERHVRSTENVLVC
jgi:CMP-N,N'-diacetyllegionaminic acid synthase